MAVVTSTEGPWALSITFRKRFMTNLADMLNQEVRNRLPRHMRDRMRLEVTLGANDDIRVSTNWRESKAKMVGDSAGPIREAIDKAMKTHLEAVIQKTKADIQKDAPPPPDKAPLV